MLIAKRKKYIIGAILILVLIGIAFFCFRAVGWFNLQCGDSRLCNKYLNERRPLETPPPENNELKKTVAIGAGDTFGVLMDQAGLTATMTAEIYQAAAPEYDLAKIKIGHDLELYFAKDDGELQRLIYKIDSEAELVVSRETRAQAPMAVNPVVDPATVNAENEIASEKTDIIWQALVKPIDYEVKIAVKIGRVVTSMYEAALAANIDERAIIDLADAFQWSLDFATDPRVDDTFKLVYEERYLDGVYIMPGRIFAGEYINVGQKHQVYYFFEDEENVGYFDENGNSVQKMFLRAPVSFKYISSGFTTGLRYVEAFDVATGHRAVDYAAAYGVPIRSVGDGTVISAGWNGSYGNMVKVRHNGTYQTNYGHMSKLAVRAGVKIKQGDVIGYVGSTGFSTGPHVHFEMVKNGVKINPLTEVLPPGQAIKPENKERFLAEAEKWRQELEKY